jgi:hypothetical protein
MHFDILVFSVDDGADLSWELQDMGECGGKS